MLKLLETPVVEEEIIDNSDEAYEGEVDNNITEFEEYADEIIFLVEDRKKITDKVKLEENSVLIEKELQKYEDTPVHKFVNLIMNSDSPDNDVEDSIIIELNSLVYKYMMGCKIVRGKEPTYKETVVKLGFDKLDSFNQIK